MKLRKLSPLDAPRSPLSALSLLATPLLVLLFASGCSSPPPAEDVESTAGEGSTAEETVNDATPAGERQEAVNESPDFDPEDFVIDPSLNEDDSAAEAREARDDDPSRILDALGISANEAGDDPALASAPGGGGAPGQRGGGGAGAGGDVPAPDDQEVSDTLAPPPPPGEYTPADLEDLANNEKDVPPEQG
ncbi:MAG: hypothetical protein AAGD01_15295 [Acidobacteriota bacterium]